MEKTDADRGEVSAPKLLKPYQAAEMLGISKAFTYQLVRQGQLKAVKFGKTVRFRRVDIEAFIASNLTLDD